MKVEVTSTVVLDIENDDLTVQEVGEKFLAANKVAIGMEMRTVTGIRYAMRAIEKFSIQRRDH